MSKISIMSSALILMGWIWQPLGLLGPIINFLSWLSDVKLTLLNILLTIFSFIAVPMQNISLVIANFGGIVLGTFFYFRHRELYPWKYERE